MAVQKKPIYVFEGPGDTGINIVPDTRMVMVEDTHNVYVKKHNNGLGNTSTVQDAINNGNMVLLWSNENDGPYSGLQAQSATYWGTQNGGQGYRLINVSTGEPQPGDGDIGDIWFQRDA